MSATIAAIVTALVGSLLGWAKEEMARRQAAADRDKVRELAIDLTTSKAELDARDMSTERLMRVLRLEEAKRRFRVRKARNAGGDRGGAMSDLEAERARRNRPKPNS